jgi:hypothetical protein
VAGEQRGLEEEVVEVEVEVEGSVRHCVFH